MCIYNLWVVHLLENSRDPRLLQICEFPFWCSMGPFSKFKRHLWKGQLFELPSLQPRKWLNLYWPYHLKVTKDMYHDLNPIPLISSRANTLEVYHSRRCYSWKKERQSDQPCSLIKITPNTLGEGDKHPASVSFHPCCPPSAWETREVLHFVDSWTEGWGYLQHARNFFQHLQLTNPLWNYKQESLWLQRVALVLGKQTLLQDIAQWIM